LRYRDMKTTFLFPAIILFSCMTSFGQSGMNGYVPYPGYVPPMPGYGGPYNIPNHGGTNTGGTLIIFPITEEAPI